MKADRSCMTSIHFAAKYDSLDAFLYIASRGADVGIHNFSEYRPVDVAAANASMNVSST